MLHKDIPISGTVSSGVLAINTDNLVSCLCKLILVKATNTDTTFDFKLINYRNDIVYHKEGVTYVLRENIELPLKNIVTLRIENASADEAFTGLITVQE